MLKNPKNNAECYLNMLGAANLEGIAIQYLKQAQDSATVKYPYELVLEETMSNGLKQFKAVFFDGSEILSFRHTA